MVSYKRAYKKLIKIIIILAIIEVSAQTISFIYKYGIYKFNKSGKGEFRILCLGDSVTFGVGSPVEFSYPYQLERLLNKKSNGKVYKLINAAVPGFTSFEVKENLDVFLERYNPNMVILLIGTNDWWKVVDMPKIPFMNFNNYNEIIIKVKLVLNKIFLFRLIDIASLNIKSLYDKIKEKNIPQEAYLYPKEKQDREFLIKFIRNNLFDIVYRLKSKNIKIIFMNYPRAPDIVNQIIRDTAEALSIKLIDNEILFKKLDDEYFCKDKWHPNAYGNILMAVNAYCAFKNLDYSKDDEISLYKELIGINQNIEDTNKLLPKTHHTPIHRDIFTVDLHKVYTIEKIKRPGAMLHWYKDSILKINTNFVICEKFQLEPAEYVVEISAYGTALCNEYPEVVISVNNSDDFFSKNGIGKFFVDEDLKVYKSDVFSLDEKGVFYLFVEFVNDAYERDVGDRNLFIKNIILKKK